jgi:ketosteroid isomerase-like protein
VPKQAPNLTQENVQIVRSIYAGWERGDFGSADWAHPEIEYVVVGGPEPGRWRGLAEMAQSVGDFMSAWEDYRITARDYRGLNDGRVLVLVELSGRGKASGFDIGQMQPKGAGVFELSDGKVKTLVLYWDRERAFADLGLQD